MNISENKANTEELRGYKYRKEMSKTSKVLLRKFKANYREKNNLKNVQYEKYGK